jgi:6-pyruvoyltetrahydropterin/6-carboxytetrahydropterin synthase
MSVKYESTKIIELGSCAFRQWKAVGTHCRFVHGYRLMAKFWFSSTVLDHRNWVVNFGGLKELKDKLQKQFDHTLCVAQDDPLLEHFKILHNSGGCDLRIMDSVGIEKVAEWCFKAAEDFIYYNSETKDRVTVEKVEVWEHELNSATYSKKNYGNLVS